MENKLNITPTPVNDLINDLIPAIENKGHISYEYLKEALFKAKEKESIAVNNTYGKGIDPEKIGELIKTLEEIKSICDGNITNENNIWHKCNKTLNKIKLK